MYYYLQKQKYVEYMNINKNLLVSGKILKSMDWFFTITSGQMLCWVLVKFMLDEYHVGVMHVEVN